MFCLLKKREFSSETHLLHNVFYFPIHFAFLSLEDENIDLFFFLCVNVLKPLKKIDRREISQNTGLVFCNFVCLQNHIFLNFAIMPAPQFAYIWVWWGLWLLLPRYDELQLHRVNIDFYKFDESFLHLDCRAGPL